MREPLRNAPGLNYLNNRYQDPTTGVFISVDPLVAKTGEPHLYAAGNPTTLSDPTGLEPGCGATAHSGSSCRDAYTASSNSCILAAGCGGKSLVDSIHDTKHQLGGAVFSGVEGADVGGHLDGNWGNKSIDAAAAGGAALLDSLRALGIPEDQLLGFARLVQSVGERLQGHKQDFERIDHEKSWWEKHGTAVLTAISTVALVSSIFLGPEMALVAGFVAAAADTTSLAYHMNNGTCGSGCGDLALDIPLDLISGGLARTGRTGYSLLTSAFQFTSHQTPGGFGEPYAWNVNVPAIVASYSNRIA